MHTLVFLMHGCGVYSRLAFKSCARERKSMGPRGEIFLTENNKNQNSKLLLLNFNLTRIFDNLFMISLQNVV